MTRQRLDDGTQNPAWVAARRGALGGSTIDKIISIAELKGAVKPELSAGAITLARQLALERFYSHAFNNAPPNNPDIMRGLEHEPMALAEYELRFGVLLRPACWLEHPTLQHAGCTADAFCDPDGLVQVKCPRMDNYGLIIASGERPTDFDRQMQWEMAVTGRKWNDLAIYCADYPEGQQLWVRRVHRDDEYIAKLEAKAEIFLLEVEAIFEKLHHIDFTGDAA